MPFFRRILRLYSMDRSPLSDITNAPPSSPTGTTSGSSGDGNEENEPPASDLSNQQCAVAVSPRNWKSMDNHLLERMLYSRIPNSPLDAETLRDFYKAKRNGWLNSENPTFLCEILFIALPTLDLDLYTIRESMFEKGLQRYQYSEEQSNDVTFTVALGKKWVVIAQSYSCLHKLLTTLALLFAKFRCYRSSQNKLDC